MRSLSLLPTLGALALLAAVPTLAAPPQLVTRHGIGAAHLGEARGTVAKALGDEQVLGTGSNDFGPYARVRYPAARLVVSYIGDGSAATAVTIRTSSTRYATRQGIRVGATRAALRKAHRAAYCDGPTICYVGELLPGAEVMTFRLKAGRVVALESALVVD